MRASQGLEKCNNLTSFKLPETYCLDRANRNIVIHLRYHKILIFVHQNLVRFQLIFEDKKIMRPNGFTLLHTFLCFANN